MRKVGEDVTEILECGGLSVEPSQHLRSEQTTQ